MNASAIAPAIAVGGAVLLLLSGCGDDGESDCSGQPPEDGRTLFYEVREEGGATPAEVEEAAGILCERLDALEVEGAVVRPKGETGITVIVPQNAPKEVAYQLGRAARLRFYDWEANLVPAPGADPDAPIESLAEAEDLAAGFDDAIVIRAEPPLEGYYVVRNRSELSNDDIESAELGADPATGNPTIELDFTPRGEVRFTRLSREISRRAKEAGSDGHFAVVVDAELVALPVVEPGTAPKGAVMPGIVMVVAVPPEELETLVELLEIGHQPLDLRLDEKGAG